MSSTLLFDLDNTLVDRDAAMGHFADQWCVSDETRAAMLASDAGGQGCREGFAALLDQHVPQKVPWTPKSIALMVASRVTPSEAVIAMLERLKAKHRLGLVTNGGGETQREKLRRAELSQLFSVVCISGESGFPKPAPQMFRSALRELDCSPRDALFVGDSLRCDILGAAKVGMRTCWVDTHSRTHPAANLVISHVLELEAHLSGQEAAA